MAAPLAVTFEQAAEALAQLQRMFVELDGSFVWVAEKEETRDWPLDGNLQDRNERLLLVDVKGTCPSNQFDRLLRCIGWPATRLIFQLVREAVFLDEEEFRRYAAAQAHVVS